MRAGMIGPFARFPGPRSDASSSVLPARFLFSPPALGPAIWAKIVGPAFFVGAPASDVAPMALVAAAFFAGAFFSADFFA
jgi:hypothetical protein